MTIDDSLERGFTLLMSDRPFDLDHAADVVRGICHWHR